MYLYCHNCYNFASDTLAHGKCTGLEMKWLWTIGILIGRALRERQCTLEKEAQYMNVWGSVHWKGVYMVREWTLGCKIFLTSY